ncbi:ATP-dependent DNA helicase RecQ-like [Acropora millepora]|uniref:ATP-dependent DNA helicase RecQ-like n=1 Tax=Acropora millepora TaxID=45264 RepID=UPI001CF1FB24|nr:ATP-dependent DNA helicase RecQ-like [Acropora millepora]
MWMHEHVSKIHWKENPIVVIISPLLSLMQDQVKKLSSLGLKATYVGPDQDPSILQKIEQGNFTYVYISPESTLATERGRNTLDSQIYQERMIGVVVDEVHCVTEWGTSSNNKQRSAFRVWYSRLNELRSLVDAPFITLTATAKPKTKAKIFELLELREPKEIVESPNKPNVRYAIQKLRNSLPVLENFRCLIDELKEKGIDRKRTIIYCQTVKQCAHLFRKFELELGCDMYDGEENPKNRLVEMRHSGSPESVKTHVLHQFSDNNTCLRILVATIAYGMGVNCKGVSRVIHFGPSKSIEAYLQETGRCGRDGEQSDALLLYNGITSKCQDGHYCDVDLHLPIETTEEEETQVRKISSEQFSLLKKELHALKKTFVMESTAAADDGCISSIQKYVDMWQKKHSVSVLKIFQLIFNDIEEPMIDSDSEEDYLDKSNDEWVEMVNDQSFMELLDQSEWEVDSALLDESFDDGQDDEPAYPEFLDTVIGNINIE